MKIKSAVLILAKFVEQSSYRDSATGDRSPSFMDGAQICELCAIDPKELDEALQCANGVMARSLLPDWQSKHRTR